MYASIKKILLITIIMLGLDTIYLGLNKNMFEQQISDVQGGKLEMNLIGAIPCYIFLVLGLYYFIIRKNAPLLDAFLFGLVIYGVYETTNYTILKKWRPFTVVMDTLWGGLLMTITTYLTYWFYYGM
jgi:uncharacterized membrane protein